MRFNWGKMAKRLSVGSGIILALLLGSNPSFGQKGSGSASSSASAGGSSGAGGQAGQSAAGQGGGSGASGPSSRVEASMLAYEASDKIAARIADQVKGHTLYIYDGPTFASVQAYEAYAATVSTFEMSFRLFMTVKPQSSFMTSATGAQTVAATITALRSTAEYTSETVNIQTDPIIAQLAHHLGGSNVIVPKFLLLSADDLQSSGTSSLQENKTSCADIKRTIPDQLGCLQLVRNNAAVAISADKSASAAQAAFADLDKLFQAFLGPFMGTSVSLSSTTSGQAKPADSSGDSGQNQAAGNAGAGQAPNASVLSQIIQGHRLKAQFNSDPNSRVLVLETTEAGGGSMVRHILFEELFWKTPTPTFTGGAIVTYLLIDPATSRVEKSEVLRFTVDYSKFHGRKIEAPSNFEQ